ncbi:SPFH domain-containing protein [Brevundimonas sp.]|uniref:SPFH domain-containing protein n=1 Tax=Brevundimonas sp. TaxID=1871086 RepID=UPI003D6CD09A
MAEIKSFGFWRLLRSDASAHIQLYRRGTRRKSGRGLAFWFAPDGASIAQLPMDDRELPFLFKSRSRDFQEVTVQGVAVWRIGDPEAMADRIDFSIDLRNGLHLGRPVEQIESLLAGVMQQHAAQYLTELEVGEILTNGVRPLHERIAASMLASPKLDEMGLTVIDIRIADISPASELERALKTPTFERLQQQADQATFERRALAVEKERAIAENELSNQIELARRQKQLIEREDDNARGRAEAEAAAKLIAAEGEAQRIRTIQQAKTEMERARVAIYSDQPPGVMVGLAAQEFAGKLHSIEHLNITPDMLSALLGGYLNGKPAPISRG